MPRFVRIGRLVGSTSSPSFVSSNFAVPGQDYPIEGVVLGNVNVSSEEVSPGELSAEDADAFVGDDDALVDEINEMQDEIDNRPYVSFTRRAFQRRLPARISRAALKRATGEPKYFMSSAAPPTGGLDTSGALLIDTDGFRVQDGDDF